MSGETVEPSALPVATPAPDRPAIARRAGDADRERAVVALREATIEGRLTLEEFSGRLEQALEARTDVELAALLADLAMPAVHEPATLPTHRRVIMSRLARQGRWQLPPSFRLSVLCGTVTLDLGQAVIRAAVTSLHVHNLFSTVTILVPDAIQVEIDDGGAMLTHEIRLPEGAAPASAPLVRIRLTGIGGTNRIHAAERGTTSGADNAND